MDDDFERYWRRFVRDHQQPGTQWAHLVGNVMSVGIALGALLSGRLRWLLFAPTPALVLSRLSHQYIERNVPLKASDDPASFLRCELRMAHRLVTGRMADEVAAAQSDPS